LSRSPIAIRQIIAIREDLNLDVRPIKEIVVFDEDEVTEEMLQNRAKNVTTRIHELQKTLQKSQPTSSSAADHPGEAEST
jgi:RNA polymerase primary sigma factor